jgi:hypothetical protein
MPFKFTGKIAKVTIELKEMKKTDNEKAGRARREAAWKKGLADSAGIGNVRAAKADRPR